MTVELTADIRTRLDAHLDAVEDALRRLRPHPRAAARHRRRPGGPDSRHARQLLRHAHAGRLGSGAPEARSTGSLRRKHSGHSFHFRGDSPSRSARPDASTSPCALFSHCDLGFVLIIVSLFALGANRSGAGVTLTRRTHPCPWRPLCPAIHVEPVPSPPAVMGAPHEQLGFGIMPCLGLSAVPLALAGTVLGWIAFFQIRSSLAWSRHGSGAIRWMFYPILLLGVLILRLTVH